MTSDVKIEANILARFSHPYLPYLFGIVIKELPYRIVMQYHGISGYSTSVTLHDTLSSSIANESIKKHILMFCCQLVEALSYLHCESHVLHNDLKPNNVVICDTLQPSDAEIGLQIVVIDFGKATTVDKGRRYSLNSLEKSEHIRRYPHIAPEVTEGITSQTTMSDVYSLGYVFQKVVDSKLITDPEAKSGKIGS